MQRHSRNPFHLELDMNDRVFGLDLYRAAAILLVVFVHGGFLLRNTALDGFPYVTEIDGVDLFFALSGFLIGGILLKIANRDARMSIGDTVDFWKRRWFRTLPNYYLILLLNYIFLRFGLVDGDASQFSFRFLIFSQNLSSPFHFFLESWSLTIEEWFYILLPLLLMLASTFLSRKYSVLLAVAALLVASLVARILISIALEKAAVNVDVGTLDERFRKTVVTRMDAIGYGVLAAWTKYYYRAAWSRHAKPAFVTGLILLVASALTQARFPNLFFTQTFSFLPPAIGAALLLPMADSLKSCKGWIGRYVTHISLISYSMYLVNYGLVVQVLFKHFPPHGIADALLKYGVYWVVVISASTLLYKYFEKPVMDLRDRRRPL
jgi:peptidoglycan/LPS O-acetylase OafA/YrhL